MRAPSYPNLFALLMGTGAQVALVYFLLLTGFFAHMLSNLTVRPILYYFTIFLLSLTGIVNGYVLVRFMKIFNALTEWKEISVLSSILLPLDVAMTLIMIDLLEYDIGANPEFDLSLMVLSACLWMCVGIPTTLSGAFLGFKADSNESLGIVKRNRIPRKVPELPSWLEKWRYLTLASGFVIFLNFYFVLSLMW